MYQQILSKFYQQQQESIQMNNHKYQSSKTNNENNFKQILFIGNDNDDTGQIIMMKII